VQGTLKELEASLQKLETEKQELVEENKNLKSTGEVLQKITIVQDKASEHLGHAANTDTGQGNHGVSRHAAATKSEGVRPFAIVMPNTNIKYMDSNGNRS